MSQRKSLSLPAEEHWPCIFVSPIRSQGTPKQPQNLWGRGDMELAIFSASYLPVKPENLSTSSPSLSNNIAMNNVRFPSRRKMCICSNINPSPEPVKSFIELEFIGPKAEADGSYLVGRASASSGEKLLRNIMIDNKIELYAAYGKIMNCGGGGSCGTCIVEIVNGKDLLNERTDTEKKYLKKKPESWRLACQVVVGDERNSGKIVVQRLPQWKQGS